MNTFRRPLTLSLLLGMLVTAVTTNALHAADRNATTPAEFLTTWSLDREIGRAHV
jgi:hypothetical protein